MARPVVIVGGGMAGLSCAWELERAGVPYTLLEAEDRVGGRVKTDVVDGFRLDRGYQVHFDAYPNVARVAPPETLGLGLFEPGAAMRDKAGTHLIDSPKGLRKTLHMATERSVSLKDKLLVRKWTNRVKATEIEGLREMPDMSTERHLREYGFSEEFLTKFLRPFLGGVFLDRSLGFSRQQFAFLWKMLSEGNIGLPKEGMEAIPRAVLAGLSPGNVRTYARAERLLFTSSGDLAGVRLATRETVEAGAIVLALDPVEAGRLLGDAAPPELRGAEYRGSTTVWFAAGKAPTERPYLVLNATGNGIVNTLSPSSLAQPSYAPKGRQLVAASILEVRREPDARLAEMVQAELDRTMPETGAALWKPLRVDRIERAHLKEPPGYAARRPKAVTDIPGVLLAGEVTTNASLDGAAESGLRAARKATALLEERPLAGV